MVTDVWDDVWDNKKVNSDYSLNYLNFIEKLDANLSAGKKIIEVGCGTGQTLEIFSRRHSTTGLDISKNALKIAKSKCDNPVNGDMFNMPFPDETFDLVYNSGVIEHFREPGNIRAIKEMARITRKGGNLMIIVPNSHCLWYRIWKYLSIKTNRFEFGYEEDYSLSRLKNAINRASPDLEIIDSFGIQALLPLATNNKEILSENIRKKICKVENYFPYKQHYAYGVGVIAKKSV
ncbi:class I SAM-dependent methyltransferase [Methanoplanus sp. FWC-SCC4]|uniref:Class I SAM-dependent methyltransferase n=1 Tax=Methanochimaera problematica TaxID=2609417 RepID=A0AA97FCT1_9EURY|nr:class I SAM-dependent methyltransferase [Methanoplanus sp. FWC-SCC4]WOF17125.1 class I SAM-dependent methyltransferase [Methanoplanus sp. FWC-SCC4]